VPRRSGAAGACGQRAVRHDVSSAALQASSCHVSRGRSLLPFFVKLRLSRCTCAHFLRRGATRGAGGRVGLLLHALTMPPKEGGGHGLVGGKTKARHKAKALLSALTVKPTEVFFTQAMGRALHSSTPQLSLNAFCMTGGAVRGCFGGILRAVRA